MSIIRDDRRSEADKEATVGFVVGTDRFLSGWGQAPNRSLFAVPVKDFDQAEVVAENMRRRGDMLRVRIVGKDYRPRLYDGDHFSIRDMSDCSWLYAPVKYN